MGNIVVSYRKEGSFNSYTFDSMDDAQDFVTSLLEEYGDSYIQDLTIEKRE